MKAQSESQQLALETIARKNRGKIPTDGIHIMDTDIIDELAGMPAGSYIKNPVEVYLKFKINAGVNLIDQFIPTNPLSMTKKGFDETRERGATTGLEKIIVDGIRIDSPESVVEHMEKAVFPKIRKSISDFDEKKAAEEIISRERKTQEILGPSILKTGYGFVHFPYLRYGTYGYANYFMAYTLYPEIMEKDFSLQADLNEIQNKAAARAIIEGELPLLYRLDHDMADSRSTLVDIKSLEKIWFPYFERAILPVAKIPGMNLIWHCDGNLMSMIPGLIECGVKGFQGFQYEAGMDYPRICKMKAKDRDTMIIIGGVSVTKTLPFGTPEDVKKELKWLVDNGPETGLFLGASSSITPNTNRENIMTLVEGLKYYREHGRQTEKSE